MFITWFILLVSLAITSMASSLPAVPGAIGGKLSTGRNLSTGRRRSHNHIVYQEENADLQVVSKCPRQRDAKGTSFTAWISSTECVLDEASGQEAIDSVLSFARKTNTYSLDLDWVPRGIAQKLRATATEFGSDTNRIIEVKQGGKNPSLWTVNPEHTSRKLSPKPRNYALVERRKLDRLYAERKELKVTRTESKFKVIFSSIPQNKPAQATCVIAQYRVES